MVSKIKPEFLAGIHQENFRVHANSNLNQGNVWFFRIYTQRNQFLRLREDSLKAIINVAYQKSGVTTKTLINADKAEPAGVLLDPATDWTGLVADVSIALNGRAIPKAFPYGSSNRVTYKYISELFNSKSSNALTYKKLKTYVRHSQ